MLVVVRLSKIHAVKDALARQAAVALVGARQVGKTTLALDIAETTPSLYLDLESEAERRKLAEPADFLSRYEDKLVILDEIHKVPELFSTLRGLIDQGRRRGRRTGRFLLLGSASMDLLRQSGESLAGRIATVDMGPFDVLEIENTTEAQTALWVRGGFPDSFLAGDETSSYGWRKDFIRSYLEREIPTFGPKISTETLESLWTMLAHNQGCVLNASRLAGALMTSAQTITRYVDLLAALLLVRRLRPYHRNTAKRLVKAPKVYLRDSGIVHTLLGIADHNALFGHPVVGMSWEGFVIENLLAAAPELSIASYYRTQAGAEIDLVLDMPGVGVWAIEVKRGAGAKPEKGFHIACDDIKPDRRLVVGPGEDRYPIKEGVEYAGVIAIARELVAARKSGRRVSASRQS
jgi:predicted AAA+ superfamily ATPase